MSHIGCEIVQHVQKIPRATLHACLMRAHTMYNGNRSPLAAPSTLGGGLCTTLASFGGEENLRFSAHLGARSPCAAWSTKWL